jgi:3D (Asp-Asp-Asp) domain-containing protein
LLNLAISNGDFKTDCKNVVSKFDEGITLQAASANLKKITVDVTAYSPRPRETDSTPFTTASNKRVQEGYIAISRDLEAYLSFGDKVYIKDIGIFEVQDRMNRRWRKRVDLFFFDTKQALKFGKIQKEMWILESRKLREKYAKNNTQI